MTGKSSIEWTDSTWNPIRGCSRVSEGCRNCYAEHIAARFSGPGLPFAGFAEYGRPNEFSGKNGPPHWTGKIGVVESALDAALHWKRPRRVFVNSMSDLFHGGVSDGTLNRIFAVMALTPQHTYQILTKRPERMRDLLNDPEIGVQIDRAVHALGIPGGVGPWPLPNVWLGVSAENQPAADDRIPPLLATPAAVRFVSLEPLLGDISFRGDLKPIDWVIVGGESGPGARPMHPDWARSIRDQCQAAGVAFFFRQWGEWAPIEKETKKLGPLGFPGDAKEVTAKFIRTNDGLIVISGEYDKIDRYLSAGKYEGAGVPIRRVGKARAGRLLDGREWNEYPGGHPSRPAGTLPEGKGTAEPEPRLLAKAPPYWPIREGGDG